MARPVNYVAVPQSLIDILVEQEFAAAQEKEDREKREREAAEEGVADDMIKELADQLVREAVEAAKQQACMDEGLPPAVLQLLAEYDVI